MDESDVLRHLEVCYEQLLEVGQKKGNTSSAVAALGNAAIAILKGVAAALSGSGAMFASAMHSVADAVNQGFVFVGSVLASLRRLKWNRRSPG